MSNTNRDRLLLVQEQTHDDIYDALRTIETYELPDQKGAEDQLDGIAELARALSKALNDLCNCLHIRELAAWHHELVLPEKDRTH